MWKKIGLGLGVAVVLFLAFVATRNGHFRYERSGIIQAPAEKIFPYLSHFEKGREWSPYEKVDPNMKRNIIGPDGQVGTVMEFNGNKEAGSGKLEFLKIVPNELVEIRLTMTEPFMAENLIQYKLTPETGGTRFTWTMEGDGGFLGKLLNVFIDCEAMVAGDFTKGIQSLKEIVEAQK
jgi:uncharacterized protein YndB with AHSA1/START domain